MYYVSIFFLKFYKNPLANEIEFFYNWARPKRLWMISSVGRAADS